MSGCDADCRVVYRYNIFILLVIVAGIPGGCCSPITGMFCCKPMECPPAKAGFARFEPVVLALKSFKNTTGRYPLSLKELEPDYISILPAGVRESAYSVQRGNYLLEFSYSGPGMNTCIYSSKRARWACRGYF